MHPQRGRRARRGAGTGSGPSGTRESTTSGAPQVLDHMRSLVLVLNTDRNRFYVRRQRGDCGSSGQESTLLTRCSSHWPPVGLARRRYVNQSASPSLRARPPTPRRGVRCGAPLGRESSLAATTAATSRPHPAPCIENSHTRAGHRPPWRRGSHPKETQWPPRREHLCQGGCSVRTAPTRRHLRSSGFVGCGGAAARAWKHDSRRSM